MTNQIRVYGKKKGIGCFISSVHNRFIISDLQRSLYNVPLYTPKIKRLNFIFGIVTNLILISPFIPFGFVAMPKVMRFMIK